MTTTFTASPTSIRLKGKPIPGAEDRQGKITGFDQAVFPRAASFRSALAGLRLSSRPRSRERGLARSR